MYKTTVLIYNSVMSTLIEEIKESQNDNLEEIEAIQDGVEKTWLIFSVNDKQYAIEAPVAKEILRNMDIYPLPFVPEYIKGVINRHGNPYTVIDLAAFFGDEQQEASLFIVMNLEDNQFCVQITDILDFHTANESSVIHITETEDLDFFNGTIEYQEKNVPIILIDKIYETIRKDLEK